MSDRKFKESVVLMQHVAVLNESVEHGAATFLVTEIPDEITREYVEAKMELVDEKLEIDDEMWEGFQLWEKVAQEMMMVVRITRERQEVSHE